MYKAGDGRIENGGDEDRLLVVVHRPQQDDNERGQEQADLEEVEAGPAPDDRPQSAQDTAPLKTLAVGEHR
jgi:hypothetical protein